MLLRRYQRTAAIKRQEFNPRNGEQVDPITNAVRSGDRIRGVLEGDPSNYNAVRLELSYISSVRGLVGQVVATLVAGLDLAEQRKIQLRSRLFVQYQREIMQNLRDGKPTEAAINALIYQNQSYQSVVEDELKVKETYFKFYNMRDDLQDLENALKKTLDMGKDQ